MKREIALGLSTLMAAATVNAADSLEAMFSEGKVSGQIREFSIGREYVYTDSTKDFYRKANAIGGHLKYETAAFSGLSLGAAFYTTNGFLDNHPTGDKTFDPTLLGVNNQGYSILGEAYLQYSRGNTVFKGGRQVLNTPMAGTDDARMVPNLFEAYLLINKDLPDMTIILGQVNRFAQGTFGRVYSNANLQNQVLSVTSGYSFVDPDNQVGDFVNMGTYAVGKNTSGVSVGSITYTGVKNLKVQAWDYYAYDLLNAVYADTSYSWTCLLTDSVKPFAAAQIIKENSVGDKYAGEIDSLYWAGKFGFKVANFTVYGAYSQTTANEKDDSPLKHAIVTPWGGMPAYTQGMVTRHMFLAGTKAAKAYGGYDWNSLGLNLSTGFYYASFDVDEGVNSDSSPTNGYTYGDASEWGLDFIYYPEYVKNLQVRFRGNFPSKFYTAADGSTVGWNEYRFILNYNF